MGMQQKNIFRRTMAMAAPAKRATDAARRKQMLRVWADRGRALWMARTAPGSLIVDISSGMRAPAGRGRPVHLPESLTFKLRTSTVKGKLINEIVCEGVVVETLMPSA
jgi:hypothetical protein